MSRNIEKCSVANIITRIRYYTFIALFIASWLFVGTSLAYDVFRSLRLNKY